MNVSIGMSGGVDSSAAALILKQQGYAVSGVTLKLFGEGDSADAAAVCKRLEIPHSIIDLSELFAKTVIGNFIEEYGLGHTPNPCIVCNNKIKFGKMFDLCVKGDDDYIATGHYADIEKSNGRYLLKRPADISKDQTYVLYGLSQDRLAHTVFPLGGLKKSEVRELASENGFCNADKKDSQDICFVPDGDYAGFIEDFTKKAPVPGNFIDKSGVVLGRHQGIINYTIGQRKGLGIALGKPAFVLDKNIADNTVTLGEEADCFKKNVVIKNINLIAFDRMEGDIKLKAKLRYAQKEKPCVLHPLSETSAVLEFSSPQRAPAIGQSAVFYDDDYCLGGGIIEKGY